MEREIGIIAKIIEDKEIGFIEITGTNQNIYFNAKSVINQTFEDLEEGMNVGFYIFKNYKGPIAIGIKEIDPTAEKQEDLIEPEIGKEVGYITCVSRRGYGFITKEDDSALFFNAEDVTKRKFDSLRIGMTVEFDRHSLDNRGPRAFRVKPVDWKQN